MPANDAGTLDAAAIAYGVAVEKEASPAVKKWAKSYAKKKLKKGVQDLNDLRAAVEVKYPTADERARRAAMYLVLYAEYKDQYKRLVGLERLIYGRRTMGSGSQSLGNLGGGRVDRNTGPTVSSAGQLTPAQGNASTNSAYLFSGSTVPSGPMFEPFNINRAGLHEDIARMRLRLSLCGLQLSEVHKWLADTPADAIRAIP